MRNIESQVESYIAYKQGIGVQMISGASALRQFVRYAEEAGYTGLLKLTSPWRGLRMDLGTVRAMK